MAFLDDVKSKIHRVTAYHLTHIDNLPAIFSENALISKEEIISRKVTFTDISIPEVQTRRHEKTVYGLDLHQYVPFYFGAKTPMVAVNNDKQDNIVFLQFSLEILQTKGCVISDGNAASSNTKFNVFSGVESLSFLDLKAIASSRYANNSEMKRKKQAEVLIPHQMPLQQMLRILVLSESTRLIVLAHARANAKITPQVIVSPGWYFLQNQEGRK